MALKGNLNSVDLANVFQMLSINRKEGTLNIFNGDARKSIYFSQDGVSMLSSGSSKSDSLARILLRFERITTEDLQSARNLQEQGGKPLWAVLDETAMVPRDIIQDALRLEIEEEIYNLFIWKDASFEFIEGPPPEELDTQDSDLTRLTFNVNALIMEAARRIDESEMIQSRVSSVREVFRYTGRNMDLSDPIFEESWCDRVLAAIDGRSDIDKLIEVSYVSKFDVLKILALLVDAGAVEPISADDLMKEGVEALKRGDVDQGIRFLERVGEIGISSPDQQFTLAQAYEDAGQFKAAADYYRRFAELRLAGGDISEAFDIYRKIVAMLPTDIEASDRLIEVYTDHQDELGNFTTEIVERAKVVAEICIELKRNGQAIEVVNRAISLAPEEFTLRHTLVNIYLCDNMSAEAVAEYQTMVDWYTQHKDWAQVTKLLQKILVIDRSREDIKRRLEQLLSKQEHKSRGLKRMVVVLILSLIAGGIGYAYINYELDGRKTLAAEEENASKALAEMSKSIVEAGKKLSALQNELCDSDAEVEHLVSTYREADQLLQRLRVQVDRDIKEFMKVAEMFRYTSAFKDAVRKQDELNLLRNRFEQSVDAAREEIQIRSIALVNEAEKYLVQGEPSAALARYRRASALAIDQAPLRTLQVDQKIADLERSLAEVELELGEIDQLFEAGRYGEAREIATALIREYYIPELLARVRLPLKVNSSPDGAEIHINGIASGKVTPSWIRWHPGADAIIELRHSGFSRSVTSLKMLDPKQREQEISRITELREIHQNLPKEIDWQETVEGSVEASTVSDGEHVFLGTRNSLVYRIHPRERKIEEFYRADSLSGIAAGLAVDNGNLYLATIEGKVQRISLADRRATWSKNVPGAVYLQLALGGKLLIVCDDSRRVTALDIESGRQVWQTRMPAGIKSGPIVHQGRVYVTSDDGHCYGLSLARGVREFDVSPGGADRTIFGGPSLDGSSLHLVNTHGTIYAFDIRSGKELWNYATGGEIKTTPTSVRGVVIVATTDGKVYALRNGGLLASVELNHRLRTAPMLSGDRLFCACDEGWLTAIDLTEGRFSEVWSVKLGEEIRRMLVPVIAVGDQILAASEDGEVFVLRK